MWADDEEPGNNMGQHNTDVKPLNSPHARFTFPLRNDHERARRVRLEADRYRIPPPLPCDEQDRDGSLQRHRSESWQIPDDWQVAVEPQQLELGGFETREVAVDVTAPDGFVGREVINVAAYEGTSLMGGVSLYVEGSG